VKKRIGDEPAEQFTVVLCVASAVPATAVAEVVSVLQDLGVGQIRYNPHGADPSTAVTKVLQASKLTWERLGVKLAQADGGLQIVELQDDGPLEEAGLRVEDILLGIDNWETKSLDNGVFILEEITMADETRVVFQRGDQRQTAVLRRPRPPSPAIPPTDARK
jgi:S1-C subfamily serine protease